jgi:hypothetical protein
MNGSGEKRYNSNWGKLSKKLRLIYPCAVCGETDYKLKEVHHIDEDKKNSDITNLVVLCVKCHWNYHKKIISLPEVHYNISGFSVKAACFASSEKDWFDSKKPLKLLPGLDSKISNNFRKKNIKGFVTPQGCNYYVGLFHNNLLIGVLGFSNPDHGKYSLFLKADTTPPELKYSTELLLYVLRTKEVQQLLELKFNREIQNVYSMCFSKHKVISRYRKHGEKIQEKKVTGGYNVGYLFNLGTVPSLKAAKSEFIQKHKAL